MKIVANGAEIPFNLTEEEHFGDLVKSLLSLTNQADKLVLECKLNGEVVSLLERENFKNIPIDDVELVELKVSSKSGSIMSSLDALDEALSVFIQSFSEVSDALISGQKQNAMKKFGNTLGNWKEVVNFLRVVESSFDIDFSKMIVDGKPVSQSNDELFSLLEQIRNAIVSEDTVTIGDLVEYELKDKIEEQRVICKQLKGHILEKANQKKEQYS